MDITSMGNRVSSGLSISERVSGDNVTPQPVKAASPVQTGNPVTPADQIISAEQINNAVSSINKTVQASAPNIEFSVDHDTDKLIVKIIDQQTKQVIRQIPNAEVIEIAKSLDKLQGLLIKQTA